MRNFNELGKREREIKSEVDRVKGLVPGLRNRGRNAEEFLGLLALTLKEMQQKAQGRDICRRKL